MNKEELKLLINFPLYIAVGALFFSILASFVFGIAIMQMSICFAFGMSLVTLFIVKLFEDEIKSFEGYNDTKRVL